MVRKVSKIRPVPKKAIIVRISLPALDAVSILAGLRHTSINGVVCSIIEEHIRQGRAFGSAPLRGFQFGNELLAAGMRALEGGGK